MVDALINSGFPRSAVTRLEGSSADLERALLRTGMGADEASTYAHDLPEGGALILLRVTRAGIDRAVKVMNRYVRTR